MKSFVNKSNIHETQLAPQWGAAMGWTLKSKRFPGLFGLDFEASDRLAHIDGITFVLELKKAKQNKEWGYWHALIQAQIYRFWLEKEGNSEIPIVCLMLDWGRQAGEELTNDDHTFCNQFIMKCIYMVRFSLRRNFFLEHNLRTNWNSTAKVPL